MSLKHIRWEIFFLTFALLFMVLLAGANELTLFFKIRIPVLLTLLLSATAALAFASRQARR